MQAQELTLEPRAFPEDPPIDGFLRIWLDRTGILRARLGRGAVYRLIPDSSGGGDVVGPGSSVDGVTALFDGTTGKLLKAGPAPFDKSAAGDIAGIDSLTNSDGVKIFGGLPQWTYVAGNGASPGQGEFTGDASHLNINKLSIAGYNSAVAFDQFFQQHLAGALLRFTNADGDTTVYQTGSTNVLDDPVYKNSNGSVYGAALAPGVYALDFVNGLALEELLANAGITPAVDGTYSSPTSITIVKGIITAIS